MPKQPETSIEKVTIGSLTGFVVGVTADRRSGEQIELLRRKGAEVVHGPTIRTHPLGEERELADATRALIDRPPDVTLFSTGIGVRGWLEAAESLGLGASLLDSLAQGAVLTRGHKAHGAAITAGLTPTWQTPQGTAAELLDELERRGVAGLRVAVQLDGAADAALAERVADLGADVVAVPVYRWTLPDDAEVTQRLLAAICEERVDAVTFTARPQVENLVALARAAGVAHDLVAAMAGPVTPVCVGPVCAEAVLAAGFGEPIVPERYRLGTMVHTLATAFADRAVEISLADVPLRVQGHAVVMGSEIVWLTDRERAILDALAANFGAVVSKRQLLHEIWPRGGANEHVVEVTVGRLRQRLGDAGVGVETVFRRGYRLSAA